MSGYHASDQLEVLVMVMTLWWLRAGGGEGVIAIRALMGVECLLLSISRSYPNLVQMALYSNNR